jgi:predicted nucleotidyltransferase
MIDTAHIKPKIQEIAEKYGLSLVVLFGSQATGQTHKESDIDVAYQSDQKISFDEEIQIDADLIELFKNNDVQLVNVKKASPLFLKKIVENAIVLYEKNRGIFTDLLLYSLRMYEEAGVLFDLRDHYLKHKILQYQG